MNHGDTENTEGSRCVSSEFVQRQIFSDEVGTSREGLAFDQIANLLLPLPLRLDEQQAIAAYLDAETTKLDALTAKVRAAIERLQEYRTALISAAVTGQIDVRSETVRPGA